MAYRISTGMSILEMILSIFLSSLLLLVLFRYTFFIEKTLNNASDKIDLIEKYHVAFAWLVSDIEMAGYLGCVNAQSRESIADSGGYLSHYWLTTHDNILESQYMSPHQSKVLEHSDNEVFIDGESNLKANDVVVIENCWQAEIARIKQISSVNYGAEKRVRFYLPLAMKNFDEAYMARLVQHKYFIKNTSRKNASGDWVSSLYLSDINARDEEVLENIENLAFMEESGKVSLFLQDSRKNTIKLTARKRNV